MKLYPLDTLGKVLSTLRNSGKSIVQCHGCFDVLHIGHVRHFKQAKQYGDILVVTVTSDKHVNKPNRPIFTDKERAEMVEAIEYVDYVAISDYPNAGTAISHIMPDFLVKGIDYADKGVSDPERQAVKVNGGILVFTTTEKYSTTEIIERLRK